LVYPRITDLRLSEHGASRSAGCEAVLGILILNERTACMSCAYMDHVEGLIYEY